MRLESDIQRTTTDSISTILTFYNGQRQTIRKKLQGHPNLASVLNNMKIVTVDSYQGEENDIVLLSLVRSNNRRAIGFLSCDNRACVALSRARRGFYIFGNAEHFACESHTWTAVVELMYGRTAKSKTKVSMALERRLGFNLPLQCENHGRKIFIKEPGDWEFIHGGCDKMCGGMLPCQHCCLFKCHP